MPKGDKYADLTRFLSDKGQERVTVTFEELERLCGLPGSAYQYPACWSNAGQTSLSYGWLLAGYIQETASIPAQQVVFRKAPEAAEAQLARMDAKVSRQTPVRCGGIGVVPAEKIELDGLTEGCNQFFDLISDDPHARYLSWEHCYRAFSMDRTAADPERLDYLSLHLAWYLASWGMLRGGAFLLQKDYKVHLPAVRLLLEPRWESLWELSRENLLDRAFADTVMQLAEALTEVYRQEVGETPTGTLLTKILLGTVGCTPAYDRFLTLALKETGAAYHKFGRRSLCEIGRLYAVNWDELEPIRAKCSERGLTYPPMKILDMCLFQYGSNCSKKT